MDLSGPEGIPRFARETDHALRAFDLIGRRQKDSGPDEDRRTVSATGKFGCPEDIFGIRPTEGSGRTARDPVHIFPTPAGPILLREDCGRDIRNGLFGAEFLGGISASAQTTESDCGQKNADDPTAQFPRTRLKRVLPHTGSPRGRFGHDSKDCEKQLSSLSALPTFR